MAEKDEEFWPRFAIDLNARPLRLRLDPGDRVMLFDPDGDVEVEAELDLIELTRSGWALSFKRVPS